MKQVAPPFGKMTAKL